ncbi:hypothetical protein BH10PSE6_BH10PSE6_10110 [soil metagenome]
MFIRNAWYIAAWADELGQKPLARRICDEPVVLFRDQTGRAAALVDRCCHRAAPLSKGELVRPASSAAITASSLTRRPLRCGAGTGQHLR